MDMRTKRYPPLPPKDGPRLSIVLPTKGDLRLRPLLPDAFLKQFYVHADVQQRALYSRFMVLRKFIVVSSDGDLYTQVLRTTLTIADLPKQTLMDLPSMSHWGIVKVLDLVQCFLVGPDGRVLPNIRWELVRVRWRNGIETWLPVHLIHNGFQDRLQEFYVNSINSWAFRDRIHPSSLQLYRTEVELWLFHDEFQQFYKHLRQRRLTGSSGPLPNQPNSLSSSVNGHSVGDQDRSQDIKPSVRAIAMATQPSIPPVTSSDRTNSQMAAPVSAIRSPGAEHVTITVPSAVPVQLTEIDTRAGAARTALLQAEETSPVPMHEEVAVFTQTTSATTESSSADKSSIDDVRLQPSENISVEHSPQKSPQSRIRKRIKWSQIATDDDDEDDELSELRDASGRNGLSQGRLGDRPTVTMSTSSRKTFKRLRRPSVSRNSDEDEDTINMTLEQELGSDLPPQTDIPQNAVSEQTSSKWPQVIQEFCDDSDEEDAETPSMILGEIRCVCGSVSVGGYAGRWLECSKEECGIWEHATCVGFIVDDDNQASMYVCSQCDHSGFEKRCAAAKNRRLDWMFQCCESKHSAQLMKLVRESYAESKNHNEWTHPSNGKMTLLLKVARCGLTSCARDLILNYQVNIFSTDAYGYNALHHAALGESRKCTSFLLTLEPRLLVHQDLEGRTPFHFMLKSIKVNQLCIALLNKDQNLAVTRDLASNLPIHYACQAVNEWTVEICRIILNVQPSLMTERGEDSLSPLLLLCRASKMDTRGSEYKAEHIKTIISLMLDIDIFGNFMNERTERGLSALHIAASARNHALVSYLGSTRLVDVHATTKEGETALHVAAKVNCHNSVRTLLDLGLNVVAKDSSGWIPMLFAKSSLCRQQFLHYKLTKQLSRLNRMTGQYQLKDLVQKWQREVVMDPDSFDILNDWCQYQLDRIERMDGLFLSNPYFLRLDNKLDYVKLLVFPSIRESRRVKRFVFSSSQGSFWNQFVNMAKDMEPTDFRSPLEFLTDRMAKSNDAKSYAKILLLRLSADLLREEPGLFFHGNGSTLPQNAPGNERQRLLSFYVLGELMAHFVLFEGPLNGILELSSSFLRCVLDEEAKGAFDWYPYAASLAGGFDHVLPGVRALFRLDEFRVLLNGPGGRKNVLTINWDDRFEWLGFPEEAKEIKQWWSRLMADLVQEEQQLMLLFMAETFPSANEVFFLDSSTRKIRVKHYDASASGDLCTEEELLLPFMDLPSNTLHVTQYSCYEAFRKAWLIALRRTSSAFLPAN